MEIFGKRAQITFDVSGGKTFTLSGFVSNMEIMHDLHGGREIDLTIVETGRAVEQIRTLNRKALIV